MADIVRMPVRNPTCVAFGGADYRTLYVTSCRWGPSDGDLDGQLFARHIDAHRGGTDRERDAGVLDPTNWFQRSQLSSSVIAGLDQGLTWQSRLRLRLDARPKTCPRAGLRPDPGPAGA